MDAKVIETHRFQIIIKAYPFLDKNLSLRLNLQKQKKGP